MIWLRSILAVATAWFAALAPATAPATGLLAAATYTQPTALTATSLGVVQQAGGVGTTLTLTTVADAPAGSMIDVVAAYQCSNSTISSVADSASNTYTAMHADLGNPSSASTRGFYAKNASHLAVGGTITVTFAGSACDEFINAAVVKGVSTSAPSDIQGTGAVGSSTTPSKATGTLNASPEIIVGWSFMNNSKAATFTEDAAFSSLGSNVGSRNGTLHTAYKAVVPTTTVTYGPSYSNSDNWNANVDTFK